MKTNAFIGKFNYQTFHVVGCVRARPPENLLTHPQWGRATAPGSEPLL